MTKITIVLACDQALIRQGWNTVLSSHSRFKVVGEGCNEVQTLELVRLHKPSLVVVDFDMPGVDALGITRRLAIAAPATRLVGISAYTLPGYADKVLQAGAMAYITKYSPVKELFTAVNRALCGSQYLSTDMRNKMDQKLVDEEEGASGDELTLREREIIRMVREGHSSPLIARRLSISFKTVERHRYNILKKLNLKSTVALVNYVNHHQVC